MKWSLRKQGVVALIVLIAYAGAVALVLDAERRKLLAIAIHLEDLHQREAALTKARGAITYALLRVQGLLTASNVGSSVSDDVALDVDLIEAGLMGLQRYYPEFEDEIAALDQQVTGVRARPAPDSLRALQSTQKALGRRLAEIEGTLHDARSGLWHEYHVVYDRITLLGMTINVVGVIIVAAMIGVFVRRLSWDVNKLGARAESIVTGYRGPPLDVTRRDEIGDLMSAVNRMQVELREREQKLELAREQHYHREKMAAVGSLAAAVAHEINNPIAAIAGIAQAMREANAPGGRCAACQVEGGPQLILEQTERISGISRQIAELTRPPDVEPDLLDLNELVRNVTRFVGYDKRLRDIEVTLDLDRSLPAVMGVGDHITQVLMNVLINSADAFEGITGRHRTIRATTRATGNEVLLAVTDNGHGMDAATAARAFEESFSTKPVEKGRGLGLFLCRTLIERAGGSIELRSQPGAGTTVTIHLPFTVEAAA